MGIINDLTIQPVEIEFQHTEVLSAIGGLEAHCPAPG